MYSRIMCYISCPVSLVSFNLEDLLSLSTFHDFGNYEESRELLCGMLSSWACLGIPT